MISTKLFFKYVAAIVFVCVVLYLFIIYNISRNSANSHDLIVDVYMETKCPDTELFIANQLVPTFKLLKDSIAVNIYPYGKAVEVQKNGRWMFQCQHGDEECRGNTLLTCVIAMTNQDKYVTFSSCVMENLEPLKNADACMKLIGIDRNKVMECLEGAEGNNFQHQVAVETDSLNPSLSFIPWIIINKRYSAKNQEDSLRDLKSVVCRNMKKHHPAC